MKYKFLIIILTTAIFTNIISCKPINNREKSIGISYTFFTSLDSTSLDYKGEINYSSDTCLNYKFLVNDSLFFFKKEANHGFLNLSTNFIDYENEIDTFGIPQMDFVADIFPRFILENNYVSNILLDTLYNEIVIKSIGNIKFIKASMNVDKLDRSGNELFKIVESNDYFCIDTVLNHILFEMSVIKFEISGLRILQKEFKKYSYQSNANRASFDDKIKAAKIFNRKKVSFENKQVDFLFMPDFYYYNTNNKLFKSNEIKEKLVVMEFWYISCAPCLVNLKHINELFINNRDVKFLILNDKDSNVNHINNIKNKYNLVYELYYLGSGISNKLKINEHPYTIIYDNQSKKIVYRMSGTRKDYTNHLNMVLDSLRIESF